MNVIVSKVRKQFLQECSDDYVGLWSLVSRQKKNGVSEPSQVRGEVLSLLAELLGKGEIIAGDFAGDKFIKLDISHIEIVEKIRFEWNALGRDPDIGEIIWFTAASNDKETQAR